MDAVDNPQMKLYASGALEIYEVYDIGSGPYHFPPRRENVNMDNG